MKRKLLKPTYECRCNGRLQTKRFTRLSYTGSVMELEHLKIKTRLTNEKFASVKGECDSCGPWVSKKKRKKILSLSELAGRDKLVHVPLRVTHVTWRWRGAPACNGSGAGGTNGGAAQRPCAGPSPTHFAGRPQFYEQLLQSIAPPLHWVLRFMLWECQNRS
jgi:hypothetical protein